MKGEWKFWNVGLPTYLITCLAVGCIELAFADHFNSEVMMHIFAHDGCPIRYNFQRIQCTQRTADIEYTKIIPYGETCYMEGHDHELNVTCETPIESIRTKRQAFTMAGATVGSVFGPIGTVVGGAIGFITDILCIFFCGGKDNQPPPNHPPFIKTHASLANANPMIAANGQTSAVVSWINPVIHDNEDNTNLIVTTSPSNLQSGGTFSEGHYTIFFSASDSGGLIVQTALFFEVKVIRCGYVPTFSNGYVTCDPSDTVKGSKCKVQCDRGYETNTNVIECSGSGTWSGSRPQCDPIDCKVKPNITNGELVCRQANAVYNEFCQVVCSTGYSVNGLSLISCDENGNWGRTAACDDTQPPQFKAGECPSDIQIPIDSPNNSAAVKWDIPTGTDNSHGPVEITEIHGFKPGQRFESGSRTVKYTIKDSSNNVGDSCSFQIRVQSISCDPPNLITMGSDKMMYNCPNLYTFGAECALSCKGGFPLAGANTITCLQNKNKDLEWEWDPNALKPFCKETNCTKLREPVNGAISCSQWTYGQMCLMQCQKGFDVPANIDGQFVCGKSTGLWRPTHIVPDCNAKFNPLHMHLPSEFYYYSDTCNSSIGNFKEIQENFVKALNSSKFPEFCTNDPGCQARFVDVSCGPTARRKRDLSIYRRAAPRFAYIIEFEFVLPYSVSLLNETESDAMKRIGDQLEKMSDTVQTAADNGSFNIPGLLVERDSFAPGIPSVKCPVGMIARASASSCVGCPIGHFMSPKTQTCAECPYGSYQNSQNSIECKLCPPFTNTSSFASTDMADCRRFCKPGEYSPTGLAPCVKCPSDSFQSVSMSKGCTSCPSGTRTAEEGATSKANCIRYDMEVVEQITVPTNISSTEITLASWMFLKNMSKGVEIRIVETLTQKTNVSLSLSQGTGISLTLMGHETCRYMTSMKIMSWCHVALTFGPSSVVLYMNGQEICSNSSHGMITSSVSSSENLLQINGDLLLSDFRIEQRQASATDVKQWATTCKSNDTTLYNIGILSNSNASRVIIPSMCDAEDECLSNPCGKHECINIIGDFQCRCSNGYSGRQCEIAPNYCLSNECQNGAACQHSVTNYTCTCKYGYSGTLCEKKATDGQWSSWTEWSVCTTTCGGGNSTRQRACNSPSPDPEGANCVGQPTEIEHCNKETCPECSRLRRSYGVVISCNDTVDIQRCSLACRQGLFFAVPPLPVYECGIATGYKWNHQTLENPTAALPTCSELKPPSQMELQMQSQYETVECNKQNMGLVQSQMEGKVNQLDCVTSGLCQVTVQPQDCQSHRRKRGTLNGMTLTLEMKADFQSTDKAFDLTGALSNKSDLVEFVKKTLELERVAQKIANGSVDFFQVTIDGRQHSVQPGSAGLSVASSVTCPKGSVRLEVFCAECPVGTYSDGKTITLCPIGQFQDHKGQMECKSCPDGTTTPGIGSFQLSDCSVQKQLHGVGGQLGKEDTDNGSLAVKIGLGVVGGIVSAMLLVVVGALLYKRMSKKHRGVNDSTFNLQSPISTMAQRPVFDKSILPPPYKI